MIRLAVRRVRPAEEQKLRDWLGVVGGSRSAEAVATLADEGCTHEISVLIQTSDGPLLGHRDAAILPGLGAGLWRHCPPAGIPRQCSPRTHRALPFRGRWEPQRPRNDAAAGTPAGKSGRAPAGVWKIHNDSVR